MEKMNAYDIGKEFMRAINNTMWYPPDFAKVVCNEHRFLQQEAFNTFVTCLREWAKHEHWDGRNENAVELSKVLVEVIDDFYRFPRSSCVA